MEIIYLPLYVSFDQELEPGYEKKHVIESELIRLFERVSLVIFIFDIAFNFRCGYYKKGLFITEKSKILSHYLSRQFWLDCLSVISLMISFVFDGSPYYSLVFMINVNKVNNIRKKMMFNLNSIFKIAFYIKLASLVFTIIFLSHLFSCTWYLMAIMEVQYNSSAITWIHKTDLYYEDWYVKYIYSFYYGIVTIVTVGYGDVTPQNSFERLIACFFILIGCITFGYCISLISSIFQTKREEHNNYVENISEIDQYMRKRNVDLDLQIRVRNYLEWVYKDNEAKEKEEILLKPLSRTLREEVLCQVYGKRIMKISFFVNHFSTNFLNVLALKIREISFVPDEIIFRVLKFEII